MMEATLEARSKGDYVCNDVRNAHLSMESEVRWV
jgi:hypothetical protein